MLISELHATSADGLNVNQAVVCDYSLLSLTVDENPVDGCRLSPLEPSLM